MYVLGKRHDRETFEVEEIVKDLRAARASGRDVIEVVWRPAAICRVPRRGDVLFVSAGGSKPDLAIPPAPDPPGAT